MFGQRRLGLFQLLVPLSENLTDSGCFEPVGRTSTAGVSLFGWADPAAAASLAQDVVGEAAAQGDSR